jgi:hypothetical protein
VQSGNDSGGRDGADDAVFRRLLDNARQVFGGHPAACLS